ncbi:LuxR C-terminal-related transcriptional regulator [Polymorphospora lycopeni]|uniref:LuxR C-terminal-related transcriptional regulator n=1 Tax=Polymorphospora lycopeni TaxID=3140240 RepID=A0ABV5CIE5_9ACTN
MRAEAEFARGQLALALGRIPAAVDRFTAVAADLHAAGWYDRDVSPEPELVEIHAMGGDLDRARRAYDRWLEYGARPSPRWGAALSARCAGLLADEDGYEAEFRRALALHETLPDAYALARTRLSFGERLRRGGRKLAAREQLRRAHEIFDRLEAGPWAERARRELRATGEKIRRATAGAGDQLTPQELQIAQQVAEGRTNKEVAAALFLSPKTIEFHLGRVFRKLDIGSRTELIRRMAADATPG